MNLQTFQPAPTPWAVLSCDLDPVDCHLVGYGVTDAPPCPAIYRRAVPRLLDLLDELRLRAVFFVVARDAARERNLLREIVGRGHEVASHSLTHPQPFHRLDDRALERETAASQAALSGVLGSPVCGFRAPAWDVDERVLDAIARAGYHYDTSVFPTPVLLLERLVTYCRSLGKGPFLDMRLLAFARAPRYPYAVPGDGHGLAEFPIAVTPRLRLPAYHTISHLLPWSLFERLLNAALRTTAPLSYEFHAADALDLERDAIDPRMIVHPGMRLPLERKLATLRRVLSRIDAERTVVTYREVINQ